jgi:hypothetical protein
LAPGLELKGLPPLCGRVFVGTDRTRSICKLIEVAVIGLHLLIEPKFLTRMREVRNAPEGERLRAAAMFLSIDALRNAGVDLPKDMRIASRYFEENFQGDAGASVQGGSVPRGSTAGGQTPLGVCAGGGAGNPPTCGCAGNTVVLAAE